MECSKILDLTTKFFGLNSSQRQEGKLQNPHILLTEPNACVENWPYDIKSCHLFSIVSCEVVLMATLRFQRGIQTLTLVILTTLQCMSIASVQNPKGGSIERTALLDGLRATDAMKRNAADWKIPKVTFFDVRNFVDGDWAYVQARPATLDQKRTTEPIQGVEHRIGKKWQWIDFVSDEVNSAEDSNVAFKKWQADFLKLHKDCPKDIFPTKF